MMRRRTVTYALSAALIALLAACGTPLHSTPEGQSMNLSKIADKTRPDYLPRRIADLEKRVGQLESQRPITSATFGDETPGVNASSFDRDLVTGTITVPVGFTTALVIGTASVYAALNGNAGGTDIDVRVQIAGEDGERAWNSAKGPNGFAGVTASYSTVLTGLNPAGDTISVKAIDSEDLPTNIIANGVTGNLTVLAVFLR